MTTLKLGKRAPDHSKPALLLGPHLHTVAHPDKRDWLSKVTDWPMYGNDSLGDCVWAMIGHAIEAWTAYSTGAPVEVPEAALIKGYSDVTGYDPSDPSTDQGTVLQDALSYWKKSGIAGHKILAFAKVDHYNPDEIKAALDVFGALMVGIQCPTSAMDQFNAGEPWDVVRGSTIEGGHAIHVGAFDPTRYELVTWAKVQDMTNLFADTYIDEIWAVITPEWYAANGHTPTGLDLYGLGQDLHEITGEPNPFPPQPPQPADPDHAFAAVLHGWVDHPHVAGNAKVARAAKAWLQAKQL